MKESLAETWGDDPAGESEGDTKPTTQRPLPLKLPVFVSDIVESLAEIDLLDFAQKELGLPPTTEEGSRRQPKNERIVLAISYFLRALEERGSGIEIHQGLPHVYDGSRWMAMDQQDCKRLLGFAAEKIGVPRVESRHYGFQEQLFAQLSAAGGRFQGEPDRGAVLINLMHGTLEIDRHAERLRDFKREDFLTYQLPFTYDPKATCPKFETYLKRVLPDRDLQQVLAEFFGYVFTRDLKLEKVLVLYGFGQNGKSVLFDIMNALFGEENIQTFSLGTLAKMENRIALSGKLLNFGSEISGKLDVDLFKKLASGEPIEARRLYQDPFTMRDYAKLAFNANTLPRETEQTAAYFRRFLIIPFDQVITEAEKDPDLAARIVADELPGVFNWVLDGLRRVRAQRRFSRAAKADEVLATYRMESDTVAMFLAERALIPYEPGQLRKDEVYQLFSEFCRDSGFQALNKRNFGKRLLGVHRVTDRKSGGQRFWNLIHDPSAANDE